MPTADTVLVRAIADRVREARRSQGLTLDQLAERSGVSRRMLVNVEQATTNASIATLLRIAEALGIGLPALVAPPEPAMRIRVARASDRTPLWTGANGGRATLAGGTSAPAVVELWEWTLGPGDVHPSEPHVAGCTEVLLVIEGDVVLSVAGEETALGPGDGATFSGDALHAYRNDGSVPARFALTVFEPGRNRA